MYRVGPFYPFIFTQQGATIPQLALSFYFITTTQKERGVLWHTKTTIHQAHTHELAQKTKQEKTQQQCKAKHTTHNRESMNEVTREPSIESKRRRQRL